MLENLKKLRKSRALTQAEMAKTLGIARTTYTQYETGASEPDLKMLSKIGDFFQVDMNYLLDKTNKFQNDHRIPIQFDSATPTITMLQLSGLPYLDASIKKEELFAVVYQDFAMSPLLLPDDILIVHRQSTIQDGDTCYFSIQGEESCRLVQYSGDAILLRAENSKFQSLLYHSDQITIIGKVLEIIRRL